MQSDKKLQPIAAWLAILALPLAYANVGLALLAVGFDLTAFEDLAYGFRLVASRPGGIALIRWSMLADMLGFYLMLVPLALVLWDRLKEQNWQFMSLFTLSGLGYLFFGAMGAAILSVVAPSLITAYAQATAADSLVYETTLLAFANAIYGGVWGTLNPLLAGIWWAGVGGFLWRERRTLGWVTIILAVFALLRDVKIGPIELIGLSVYFVLAPIWAAWLGVDLLRKLEKR